MFMILITYKYQRINFHFSFNMVNSKYMYLFLCFVVVFYRAKLKTMRNL